MNEDSDRETFNLLMSKDAEIERLRAFNKELLAWIKKRKNKLHPGDPIHEILKRHEAQE